MGRNIASLIAGFGTGYLATEKEKRDAARQVKTMLMQKRRNPARPINCLLMPK